MPYRCLLFLCLCLISLNNFANARFTDQTARQLINLNTQKTLQQRIELHSAALLNAPYQGGALGEGRVGKYDQTPLYRFDAFDCETYVDTVMALALATNFVDFKKKINQIRYKHSQVDFFQRNHFTSLDWIPNNKQNGNIRELSYFIAGQKTRVVTAIINRRNWYQHLGIDRIQIPSSSALDKTFYLRSLKKQGREFATAEKASIAYIPIADVVSDAQLRSRIPSASLVFLVGHDNYLNYRIGTPINVLHMGFAIWHKGQLYLRTASSSAECVLDVHLQSYLKAYLALGILKGISVWAINEAPNESI